MADVYHKDLTGADLHVITGATGLAADDQHILDSEVINLVYPVGSIYVSTVATNPGTLFGVGTWAAFGAGRVLVGLDAGQTEFDVVEETGGAKTHVLSTAELATHTHTLPSTVLFGNQSSSGSNNGIQAGGLYVKFGIKGDSAPNGENANAGSGTAHNNLQPYIVVYMWKRTA